MCFRKAGWRRSASSSRTFAPPAAAVQARFKLTVVFPSFGAAEVTSSERMFLSTLK